MSDERKPKKPYRVGYKKPPLHSRFVKGQSGNPSGKRKNRSSFRADFDAEAELPIHLSENGKPVTLTKRQAALRAEFHQAIKGNSRAFANLARFFGDPARADDANAGASEPLSESDEAMLEEFLEGLRRRREDEE